MRHVQPGSISTELDREVGPNRTDGLEAFEHRHKPAGPTVLDIAELADETVVAEDRDRRNNESPRSYKPLLPWGLPNSRLKDYYDLATLARLYAFDG